MWKYGTLRMTLVFKGLHTAGLALLGLALAAPLLADTQFTVRRMTRGDVPIGQGQCDIRLQVDGEVEVALRGDRVLVRTISGREARDDGSECNEPLPGRDLEGFNFDVRDSRGDIALLSQPERRTGFAAVVRIRDSKGGEGRYHFRITWQMTGGRGGFGGGRFGGPDYRRDNRGSFGGGFGRGALGNDLRYSGRGDGDFQIGSYRTVRLSDANIELSRGGRARVTFETEDGRPLTLTGNVVRVDGNTYVCEMTGSPRGTMHVSADAGGNVTRVTMDGNTGRDRFRLNWRR